MVNLTKNAPTVNLNKSMGSTGGLMRANLNWTKQKARMFGGGAADLDLAVMWELADGTHGVVQALGNNFGSLHSSPYIQLDADDRSGASDAGETVTINLDEASKYSRLLLFAYVYSGKASWAEAKAKVTMYPDGMDPIVIELDEADNAARSCVIAQLTPTGSGLQIKREVNYIHGVHEDIDRAYGLNWEWSQASK